MTIEEIKNILNDEHKKWSLDIGDWMGFVEELIDEVELLHKDGMTIYGMMEGGRAKAVATRCAEICEQNFGFSWLDCGKYLGAEIRKEFNL